MSKSAKYLIAVVFLLGVNLALFFDDPSNDLASSQKFFQQDLVRVERFLFSAEDDTTLLERKDGTWLLNGRYKADDGFVNSLIGILERVETNRELDNWNEQTICAVELSDPDGVFQFNVVTNPNKTKTYFIMEGTAFEVSVPGYRDNVADIFTLHSDQWRDRMIFDGSWRTIQRITVQSEGEEDFEITFNDTFFLLDNRPPADSSGLVDYLNQFQQFQVNEMISSGRFPQFDSLSLTEPSATVIIDDLKNENPLELSIYPKLENQPYHLVTDREGQFMVLDERRARQILKKPEN